MDSNKNSKKRKNSEEQNFVFRYWDYKFIIVFYRASCIGELNAQNVLQCLLGKKLVSAKKAYLIFFKTIDIKLQYDRSLFEIQYTKCFEIL